MLNISAILANYYEQHREELVAYAAKALEGDRMTAEDLLYQGRKVLRPYAQQMVSGEG